MIPLLPSKRALWLLGIPTALAITVVVADSFVMPMLGVDACIVALLLIDAVASFRAQVEVKRSAPHTASLNRSNTVTLQISNQCRSTLMVGIHQDLFDAAETEGLPLQVRLPPKAARELSYKLTSTERGLQKIGNHRIRYESPLGFWIRQTSIAAEDEVRIFPDVKAVRNYELMARLNRDAYASRLTRHRGGDTEFERLRDYSPDDEFRRIDWKSTAKRQKLTVREYQLERNQNVMFLLDCGRTMTSVWGGQSALDHALNAALMLTSVATRRGDNVGLIAFDDEVRRLVKPQGGKAAANRLIGSTYDLFPKMVEADYEAAFRALRRHIRKRTLVVLITHAIDERTAETLERQLAELLPRHLPMVALLRDADVEARARRATTDLEEICVQAAAVHVLGWRDHWKAKLTRAGALVLDTLHHRLTAGVVSQYLESKTRGLL